MSGLPPGVHVGPNGGVYQIDPATGAKHYLKQQHQLRGGDFGAAASQFDVKSASPPQYQLRGGHGYDVKQQAQPQLRGGDYLETDYYDYDDGEGDSYSVSYDYLRGGGGAAAHPQAPKVAAVPAQPDLRGGANGWGVGGALLGTAAVLGGTAALAGALTGTPGYAPYPGYGYWDPLLYGPMPAVWPYPFPYSTMRVATRPYIGYSPRHYYRPRPIYRPRYVGGGYRPGSPRGGGGRGRGGRR